MEWKKFGVYVDGRDTGIVYLCQWWLERGGMVMDRSSSLAHIILWYELWKPYLRSQMEADMKKVEAGQKRKDEVLINCLNQMKDCFVDVSIVPLLLRRECVFILHVTVVYKYKNLNMFTGKTEQNELSDAMAIFFERSNQPGGDELPGVVGIVRRCGTCNESDMALKRKPDGHFMVGCLGYPQCRNVVWLAGPISEATVTTQPCNTCSTATGPVFRIQFKFRHLEIPQGYDVNHLGCIGGCDDTLRELIQMCGTGPCVARTAPGLLLGHYTIFYCLFV